MALVRATSLTRRMLLGLGLPMAALALLLGLGGALTINNIVEGVNDRILGASARAIAETLALEDDQVTLDIPPSALGMLENDARDNVYYSVRAGKELITGYPDLPHVKRPPADDGAIVYEYARFREFPIRIAAMARQVPRVRSLVIVEVAETLDARRALRDRMLGALAILELLLLGLLVLLLPIAVHWGLRPLETIRRHMEGRRKADFDPLPLDHVPNELRSLIAAVNSLLARLDNAVQGIRRFTADASHQMRTPLTILRTHIDLLKSTVELPPGPARQSAVDIDAATTRLQRLLTQLLALARAEGSREAAMSSARPTDIVAVVRGVAEEHAPRALKSAIDLQFDAAVPALQVVTIGDLAGELVGNLVDNAIRYTPADGEVLVSVAREGGAALVVVEDNGPGIPPADRPLVFTRFRRLDRDQAHPGSGLGLAIVQALAEAIGATVMLTDRAAGPGLRVEVRVPIAPATS
ncbi:sensor histidine kinase [Sphingomonas sp.]|uniref:sensor histidine kinase n=1 Tax=Sphingomonas sp. TaxID=28214 RepID=UPI003D6D2297